MSEQRGPQSPEDLLAMIGERREMPEPIKGQRSDEMIVDDPMSESDRDRPLERWGRCISAPLREMEDASEEFGIFNPPRKAGRVNFLSGYRSKEENDRAKEIAREQIEGPRYQYIPTPPIQHMGDPRKAIDESFIPGFEGLAEDLRGFADLKQIHDTLIRNVSLPPSLLGIDIHEPDADVMGYLHSEFGVEPEFDPSVPEYTIDLDSCTLIFQPLPSDAYIVEAHLENACEIGEHPKPAVAVSAAKEIARKILTSDLEILQ